MYARYSAIDHGPQFAGKKSGNFRRTQRITGRAAKTRNLLPPVLQSRNRTGLPQLGEIAGEVFLGMMLTLDQARVPLTVTDYCRGRGGDETS
jgi:hypothetical protein